MVIDGGFDFEKPTTLSDVGLLVEEKTFHVNKDVRLSFPSQSKVQYLAVHSSYFESLFFGGFREQGEKVLILK